MQNLFKDVTEFHEFFGHVINKRPTFLNTERTEFRVGLIEEEATELKDALAAQDITEVADALADLVYVTVGMAVEMGIPLGKVWTLVHNANMEKAAYFRHAGKCALLNSDPANPARCNCGAVLYTETGKTKKPDGWQSPNAAIKRLLDRV